MHFPSLVYCILFDVAAYFPIFLYEIGDGTTSKSNVLLGKVSSNVDIYDKEMASGSITPISSSKKRS